VARFGEAHIRAAVDQARFTDRRAAGRMTEVLLARRAAILRHWFGRVNPVDGFEVTAGPDGWTVCFDDLAIVHHLAPADRTRYQARAFDHDGRPTGWRRTGGAAASGRTCMGGLTPPRSHGGYAIVELATARPGRSVPTALVHIARAASGAPHVIGVRRN
jgi:hypothetical protein